MKMNFIALILSAFILSTGCSSKKENENNTQLEFKVLGNCDMCKEDIEKSLKDVTGIISADWNVDTKMIKVSYDSSKISEKEIYNKVATSGHDSEQARASDESYDKLPECCRYERTIGQDNK